VAGGLILWFVLKKGFQRLVKGFKSPIIRALYARFSVGVTGHKVGTGEEYSRCIGSGRQNQRTFPLILRRRPSSTKCKLVERRYE
jgi:hypothetical protein